MCGTCYDAETFEEKIKKYGKDACDGSDMLIMTLDELKLRLAKSSKSEGKNSFKIFDKAIKDLPTGTKTLSFIPKKQTSAIHVTFV